MVRLRIPEEHEVLVIVSRETNLGSTVHKEESKTSPLRSRKLRRISAVPLHQVDQHTGLLVGWVFKVLVQKIQLQVDAEHCAKQTECLRDHN